MALTLFGPCEVLDHLLAENMALANCELYRNDKTGGRRVNVDRFCHLVVRVVLHRTAYIYNFKIFFKKEIYYVARNLSFGDPELDFCGLK